MKNPLIVFFPLCFLILIFGCELQDRSAFEDFDGAQASKANLSKAEKNAVERPFKMNPATLQVEWSVVATQEESCSGNRIAGGSTTGMANFTHLGLTRIEMSVAWDISRLIETPQFVPQGPAGGPVATVLSGDDYPYQFGFNPYTQQCGDGLEVTGEIVLTAANNDKVFGRVVHGETHRLDFLVPGDGIENFTLMEIVGGTGRFQNASGSFTVHNITRFDPVLGMFVIDLAEMLPGGTIAY